MNSGGIILSDNVFGMVRLQKIADEKDVDTIAITSVQYIY